MIEITKKEKFTLLSCKGEFSFSSFYDIFLVEEKKLLNENIILQVSENINITKEDFSLFLKVTEQKNTNGTSFVIINSKIDVDNAPDNINIVPTLQEAIDVIEMEAMERALGF